MKISKKQISFLHALACIWSIALEADSLAKKHTSRHSFKEYIFGLPVLIAQAVAEGAGEAVSEPLITKFFTQWHGGLILTLLFVVIVTYFVVRAMKLAASLSDYGKELSKPTRQAIKVCEDSGDFDGAAEILFGKQVFDQAAELYIKANNFIRAAESYQELGSLSKATQYYTRGGAHESAAKLFIKRRLFIQAADSYMAAGQPEKAAKHYIQGNKPEKAAPIYVKSRRYHEAALAFEKMGEKTKAAKAYKAFFEEEFTLVRGNLDELPEEALESAKKAANYLAKAARGKDAGDLLRRAGALKQAAEAYQKAGAIAEAAEIFVEVDRPMQAAKLYDAAGNREKAFFYRGEALLKKGDKASAARDFASAGEHARAAEIFVEIGEHLKAAELWALAGDLLAAADLYSLAGEDRAAAATFEEAGEYAASAEIYKKLGDAKSEVRVSKAANNYYRVGEIFLEHGKQREALKAFQQVSAIDQKYGKACEQQGDLLTKLGKHSLAMMKYRGAIEGQKPSFANISIFYKLALIAEELDELELAAQTFEHVVSIDFNYKDAGDRLAGLKHKSRSHSRRTHGASSRSSRRVESSMGGFVGNVVGTERYEIIKELARGGMGIVYKARDTVLDRIVAYKILSSELKTNKTAVKYFLREARSAAKMTHPNIVTVYDAGEQDGEYYMAMEYVEGQTLKALVTKQGPFPEKLVAYTFVHACHALAFAHGQGLVHRDIKPGNIMLAKDRVLKIMDFGLAKFVKEVHAQHTRAIGTPYYMSPEQVVGRELDGRSDIYSLGISMYECSTGVVPFAKGDLPYHHLHTEPPYAQKKNPSISSGMSDIILKCMQKSPNDRFRNVAELEAAVKSL